MDESPSRMLEKSAYHNAHEIELFKLVVAPLFGQAVALFFVGIIEKVEYRTLAQTGARKPA